MPSPYTSKQLILHTIARTQQFGPGTMNKMVSASARAADLFNHRNFGFLSDAQRETLSDLKAAFSKKREAKHLQELGISLLSRSDEQYPALLEQIPTPPPLLYYRGNLQLLNDKFALAVVGTRSITPYGHLAAHRIVPGLIQAGFTAVSGLALGVDSLAHSIALEHRGKTIAVLGTGIDDRSIYPRHNRPLAHRIIESGGLMISEYAPASEPEKHHFPVRNRIISGISLGTLVIEAHEKSGSLITAQAALDQQRNVYAVPGAIHWPTSQGTNKLIQQGAKPVCCAEDILSDFAHLNIQSSRAVQQSFELLPAEQAVLSLLNEPREIDRLVELSGLSIPQVSTALTMLELKGLIRQIGRQLYVKI